MTIRRLKSEEYPLLKNVADGFVPDPENSIAIVAEDDGEIVGRMLLVALPHIEGTWIDPRRRKGSLLAKMFRQMESEAPVPRLFAFTPTGTISGYIERLGYSKLDVEVHEKCL